MVESLSILILFGFVLCSSFIVPFESSGLDLSVIVGSLPLSLLSFGLSIVVDSLSLLDRGSISLCDAVQEF